VLLPSDNANRFVRELPKHRGPLASWTAWTAPKTMKTAEAARAVGMSEESLREINHIPARMLIKAGSTLVVPRGNALLADVSSQVADTATLALAPDTPLRKTSLKARKKDSVESVARRYRVSPAQVAEWNHVSPGATFAPGQTIVVYTAAKGGKASSAKNTRTARSKPVPGGPRGAAAPRTASSGGKSAAAGKSTARAGKATGVRPAPVAKR
jgi:membrane-bound lytic murein transglycosylase D